MSPSQQSPQKSEAPAFASLGGLSSEPASGGNKKTILIAAAALVAVAAVGYVGWTKMQSAKPGLRSASNCFPADAPVQPQVAAPPFASSSSRFSCAQPSAQPSPVRYPSSKVPT